MATTRPQAEDPIWPVPTSMIWALTLVGLAIEVAAVLAFRVVVALAVRAVTGR